MSGPEDVRVTVEIIVGPAAISGTVVEPDGRRSSFAGWLGLIDAVHRCRPGEPPPAPHRPPERPA